MIDHRFLAGNILLHLISTTNNANLYIVELREYYLNCEDALLITMHSLVADEAFPDHVVVYFHYFVALDPEVIDELVLWIYGEWDEGGIVLFYYFEFVTLQLLHIIFYQLVNISVPRQRQQLISALWTFLLVFGRCFHALPAICMMIAAHNNRFSLCRIVVLHADGAGKQTFADLDMRSFHFSNHQLLLYLVGLVICVSGLCYTLLFHDVVTLSRVTHAGIAHCAYYQLIEAQLLMLLPKNIVLKYLVELVIGINLCQSIHLASLLMEFSYGQFCCFGQSILRKGD